MTNIQLRKLRKMLHKLLNLNLIFLHYDLDHSAASITKLQLELHAACTLCVDEKIRLPPSACAYHGVVNRGSSEKESALSTL